MTYMPSEVRSKQQASSYYDRRSEDQKNQDFRDAVARKLSDAYGGLPETIKNRIKENQTFANEVNGAYDAGLLRYNRDIGQLHIDNAALDGGDLNYYKKLDTFKSLGLVDEEGLKEYQKERKARELAEQRKPIEADLKSKISEYNSLNRRLTESLASGETIDRGDYNRLLELSRAVNGETIDGKSVSLPEPAVIPKQSFSDYQAPAPETTQPQVQQQEAITEETKYNNLYNAITEQLNAGKTPDMSLVEQAKAMYPSLVAGGANVQPLPTALTGYKDEVQSQLSDLGYTPERMAEYRKELEAIPELEQVSPEFRNYLQGLQSQMDRDSQKIQEQVETGATKAGLSPYAQKKVAQVAEESAYNKTSTTAQLQLQDLQQRAAALDQKMQVRNAFIASEYQAASAFGKQVQLMMQQKENEDANTYKTRMEYLSDSLRQRGWSQEDIQTAQKNSTGSMLLSSSLASSAASTQASYQKEMLGIQQQYNMESQAQQQQSSYNQYLRQKLDAAESYEQQKKDYWAMLEASKPKEQEWWQPLASTALTVGGYAVGGAVGGMLGSAVSNYFKPDTSSGTSVPAFNYNYGVGSQGYKSYTNY